MTTHGSDKDGRTSCNEVEDILSIVRARGKARHRVSPKHDVGIKGEDKRLNLGPLRSADSGELGRSGLHDDDQDRGTVRFSDGSK